MENNVEDTDSDLVLKENPTYIGLDNLTCEDVHGESEGNAEGNVVSENGKGKEDINGEEDPICDTETIAGSYVDVDGYGVRDTDLDARTHAYSEVNGTDYADPRDSDGEDSDTNYADGGIVIDDLTDILSVDFKNMTNEDIKRLDFANLDVAYLFYCWYARINGFSTRKSKILKSCKGEILQQTFVCSREGFREEKWLTEEMRKSKSKRKFRCGCDAKFRVHIDIRLGRWYVTLFDNNHEHDLLENKFCSLLPAHRKLGTGDVLQIESFRKAGIKPPVMFGAFANNAGGYEKIGFQMKDIYNQIGKQKRQDATDSGSAIKYLKDLKKSDPLMYVNHTVDEKGMLQHLFWSDGESQMNYKIFGDVLAFDAIYKKNKYLCSFVIFSGMNHHNQTIVFATAIVSSETEQTYVWLLEQLMVVMKGKSPSSIITDGYLPMKNAIKIVFPLSHHRLCAWHLIRNATSNVAIPEFLPHFKKCMLGDFDVSYFEKLWREMVEKFGLEDNEWVSGLYERKHMWATSHIRGNFFAGIRTTSRCEALHGHMKKFVHSQISLTDFVYQFHRYMTYFRFREVEADFESHYGEEKLLTNFVDIERSASKLFTREVFYLFRDMLRKTSKLRVVDCQELSMQSIFTVTKYRFTHTSWHVSFSPSNVQFSCSCMRMESFGLPCDHILTVLVCLDFNEVPKSLVLNRWSQNAKEEIHGSYTNDSYYWDSHLIASYAKMHFLCSKVLEMAYRDDDDSTHFVDLLIGEDNRLKLKYTSGGGGGMADVVNNATDAADDMVLDPPMRTKGGDNGTKTSQGKAKRFVRCGLCGVAGHNRQSCVNGSQTINTMHHEASNEEDDLDMEGNTMSMQ